MSGQWGDYLDFRKFVQSISYFLFLVLKNVLVFKFVLEVCKLNYKVKQTQKPTEIFPPLLHQLI